MIRGLFWIVRCVARLAASAAGGMCGGLRRIVSRGSATALIGEKLVDDVATALTCNMQPGDSNQRLGSDGMVMNERVCSECSGRNLAAAQFCRHCGRPLDAGESSSGRKASSAGRASHPQPVPMPKGMSPCDRAADLYWRLESAFGGAPLIGTESLSVVLSSGGYSLRNVTVRIDGVDAKGEAVFSLEKEAAELPRGVEVRVEVASYEITEPVRQVRVSLVSAEYA